MGIINLALRCPKSFHGLTTDPQPDWGWDDIISELNVLEQKLSDSSGGRPLSTRMEFPSHKAFVMRVSDDEMEDTESSDEDSHNQSSMTGRRFACGELDLSDTDGSEDELDLETTGNRLMDKTGLEEGILIELEREHQLRVKEEIRNRLYALEADMKNENERSVAVRGRVEKYIEEKRETDRRLDKQYQRKIAEALESHLSAVQRDHQQISLIEERRIRSDAEEAKRKETALLEEKARQERAKAEAEAKLKAAKVAEEMQKAALDAERRAKEAAEKVANEKSKTVAAEEVQRDANIKSLSGVRGGDGHSKELGSDAPDKVRSAGINIKAAETALRLEEERLGKYKEVAEMNNRLRLGSNKNIQSYERQIARRVKQISGTQENFREKASDLVKIVNDPLCPQSISIAMFAKQVVSLCEVSIGATAFACARIIVIVTSQVPVAMDIVLAEFHKACIYTVPKHIRYSESAFKTKEAYYKAIGYQEKEGKIESTTSYLQRVEAYMTLYAALVQTEINGFRNLHGLKEGWAWLARFLNTLPVEPSTAVALLAFLRVAGFMLFRRYKSQFRKILNIVSREFLASLKNLRDPQANQVIEQIECYIESNQYLQEPQGWQLQTSLQSKAY
ncbi:mRNA export factor GLE1 isoform X2 [Magnolia sinica]|uniref:mRNA export factor GLE1 isoform X2 n=1 Tax=Magnolia sinica TaxID=86752 RepID=UPI00265AAC85|nr:mRNA export factor GLE1 isoform X2 [Magnolia sinica]